MRFFGLIFTRLVRGPLFRGRPGTKDHKQRLLGVIKLQAR